MRQTLTAEQKYNRKYYQAHKGEKEFEARRTRNSKVYRAKKSTKRRRNERLREKWANDAAYRQHISEYQKAWRQKRKLSSARLAKKSMKATKRK